MAQSKQIDGPIKTDKKIREGYKYTVRDAITKEIIIEANRLQDLEDTLKRRVSPISKAIIKNKPLDGKIITRNY